MNDDLYSEMTYEERPIMDDIKEAAGVMPVGGCFILAFVIIMLFLIRRTNAE